MARPSSLNRREFLALGAALAAGAGWAAGESRPQPPNIVLIVADDLGWADLSCYGSRFHETPRLDALAAGGVRFTQAYAACPVCSPTRASLMTGLYPARIGLTDFLGGKKSPEDSPLAPAPYVNHLPLELTTLPELLRGAGYTTAALGKWHLGGADSPPEANGFDVSLGSELGGGVAGFFAPKWRLGKEVAPAKDGEYLTDRLTEEACKYIRAQSRAKPFFLYLTHFAPHIPLQAKPEWLAHFEEKKGKLGAAIGPQDNALYAAMLASLDEGVGRVVDTLKAAGLDDNTVVVFTSDNGGLSVQEGANTPATSNAPFRAGKGYLYEGGLRVPLIVSGWGPRGAVCDARVCSVDLLPTFCMAAGVERAALPSTLDGVSFAGALEDPAAPQERGDLFWHYPHFSNQGGRPGSAIRRGNWKLIEWHETGAADLYDLAVDPGETTDVRAANLETARALTEALHAWRAAVGAKMPVKKAIS